MNLTAAEEALVGYCLLEPYAMALARETLPRRPPFQGDSAREAAIVFRGAQLLWDHGCYDPAHNEDWLFDHLLRVDPKSGWASVFERIGPVCDVIPLEEIDALITSLADAWRLAEDARAAILKFAESDHNFMRGVLTSLLHSVSAAEILADDPTFRTQFLDALRARADKIQPPPRPPTLRGVRITVF